MDSIRNLKHQRFMLLLILGMLLTVIAILTDIQIEQEKLIDLQQELIDEQKSYIQILENPQLNTSKEIVQAPPTHTEIEPIEFNVSAYCPCVKCCGKTDGITKSGIKAESNKTIAMDKSFPMGTQVMIEGFEGIIFEKQDIGGAIKGNRIDIFMNTHQEALEFGRRTLKVWILEAPQSAQINF